MTVAELNEAWNDASLGPWSARRLVLAVLEAHDRPMRPEEVIDFVSACTRYHVLRSTSGQFGRKGVGVDVMADGCWSLAADAGGGLESMRRAVRERLETFRRWATPRHDPAVIQANIRASERRRAARAAELARMRRVLLYAFPQQAPEALGMVDVGQREMATFVGSEVEEVARLLEPYDIIGAMDVRAVLRPLNLEPAERRLAELGPPQKTKKLNRRGRTLKITTEMLIAGSCGINRPFGDTRKLRAYIRDNKEARLRRRIEANLKSLYAMYSYGRLHGALRLNWGFLDEMIPVPWVDRAEPRLADLKARALEERVPLEVVIGQVPSWSEPWSRARLAFVEEDSNSWWEYLVDESGSVLNEDEVQLARLGERA